ncbi:hypothetical protein, partial [Streptomyces oceani]|uniref:hypothetical protein n=1 Tax=Streptomyces oceani TaxID=1075402 RepID=UPI001BAE644C
MYNPIGKHQMRGTRQINGSTHDAFNATSLNRLRRPGHRHSKGDRPEAGPLHELLVSYLYGLRRMLHPTQFRPV